MSEGTLAWRWPTRNSWKSWGGENEEEEAEHVLRASYGPGTEPGPSSFRADPKATWAADGDTEASCCRHFSSHTNALNTDGSETQSRVRGHSWQCRPLAEHPRAKERVGGRLTSSRKCLPGPLPRSVAVIFFFFNSSKRIGLNRIPCIVWI